MYFPSLQHEAAHQPEITSGVHGGYRLVSTYDLPDCGPFWGLGGLGVGVPKLKILKVPRNG